MINKFPIYVSFIASVIVGIISLLMDVELFQIFVRLAVTLPSAYVIATIFKFYFKKRVFLEEQEEDLQEEEVPLTEDTLEPGMDFLMDDSDDFLDGPDASDDSFDGQLEEAHF